MSLFNQNDAIEFIKTGAKQFSQTPGLIMTPVARDLLIEAGVKIVFDGKARTTANTGGASAKKVTAVAGNSNVLSLFNSPQALEMKEQICEMGRRCWMRDYNDGNGGNISARLGDYFLCTPTGVSKGFMKPEMVCLVDADGNQLAGNTPWKRTSEILSHLGIYQKVPSAMAVVHAHPIHATAFAMAGVEPPQCLIPEVEVFVGTIPVAEYKTPGSAEMSELLGKLAPQHQSILMGNHGVICWGTSIEDAYFKMEITDSYCRTLWVAAQLPSKNTVIPPAELHKLLELKKGMGLPDERLNLQPAQLCECDPWEKMKDREKAVVTNVANGTSSSQSTEQMTPAELESLVHSLTEEVMKSLNV